MSNYQTLSHNFEPVFDGNSEVLILGTFPSVKSRENHFYYGHPQNRFWRVLAPVRNIYGNGAKACELYRKYSYPQTEREIIKLPSTSPANAAWQMERLVEAWGIVRN